MKKLIILIICLAFMGCANGFQINDSAAHQITAYTSGRAMGLAICNLSPALDESLKIVADDFMAKNVEAIIPAAKIIELHTSFLMQATLHIDNPYGLVSDFTMLLTIFGGELGPGGELLAVSDVPRIILVQFRAGYAVSRMNVAREKHGVPDQPHD